MRGREQIETSQDAQLAPWACRAAASRGRMHAEAEHAYRTCFARDRDRVLHSTAFRRLQYKTQVFVHHEGDHFRNRLTHTLEVSQIARTIARTLGANEDLTEAIVLAHDLGHTPFGHAGQHALHPLLEGFGGFEHNRQSLRLVDWLEACSPEYRGLNLTLETRAGILKHGSEWPPHGHPVPLPPLTPSPTGEAQIANLADSIAYNAHDIEDGLRSGLLELAQLDALELWRVAREQAGVDEGRPSRKILARLIDVLVTDLVAASAERLAPIERIEELTARADPLIAFSPQGARYVREVSRLLRERLYTHPEVVRMAREGERILRELWSAYTGDPALLPGRVLERAGSEPRERAIADYLAGMTDRLAIDEHRRICGADAER